VGIRDKELIEQRFGPLWSGKNEIVWMGRTRTLFEVKQFFDLTGTDIVAIDLHELPEGRFAFRFYDGDDRRVAVFVFDAEGEILEEHRAHVAEWLGDVYHDTGGLAFDPESIVHILRKVHTEGTP
jgi:hypothetical protein